MAASQAKISDFFKLKATQSNKTDSTSECSRTTVSKKLDTTTQSILDDVCNDFENIGVEVPLQTVSASVTPLENASQNTTVDTVSNDEPQNNLLELETSAGQAESQETDEVQVPDDVEPPVESSASSFVVTDSSNVDTFEENYLIEFQNATDCQENALQQPVLVSEASQAIATVDDNPETVTTPKTSTPRQVMLPKAKSGTGTRPMGSGRARRITAKMKLAWADELENAGKLVCLMPGCQQTYVTVANFQTHFKWCTGKKKLQHCPYCKSLIFTGQHSVLQHMEVEHPDHLEEFKEMCAAEEAEKPQFTEAPETSITPIPKSKQPLGRKFRKVNFSFFNKNGSTKENSLYKRKSYEKGVKTIERTMSQNVKEFQKCVRFSDIVQKISSVHDESLPDGAVVESKSPRASNKKSAVPLKKLIVFSESMQDEGIHYFTDEEDENVDDLTPKKVTTKSRIVLNTQGYKRFSEYLKLTRDWASERRTYSRSRMSEEEEEEEECASDILKRMDAMTTDDVQDVFVLNTPFEGGASPIIKAEKDYGKKKIPAWKMDMMGFSIKSNKKQRDTSAKQVRLRRTLKECSLNDSQTTDNFSSSDICADDLKPTISYNQSSVQSDELNYGHMVFSKPSKIPARPRTTCYDNAATYNENSERPPTSSRILKESETNIPQPIVDFDTFVQAVSGSVVDGGIIKETTDEVPIKKRKQVVSHEHKNTDSGLSKIVHLKQDGVKLPEQLKRKRGRPAKQAISEENDSASDVKTLKENNYQVVNKLPTKPKYLSQAKPLEESSTAFLRAVPSLKCIVTTLLKELLSNQFLRQLCIGQNINACYFCHKNVATGTSKNSATERETSEYVSEASKSEDQSSHATSKKHIDSVLRHIGHFCYTLKQNLQCYDSECVEDLISDLVAPSLVSDYLISMQNQCKTKRRGRPLKIEKIFSSALNLAPNNVFNCLVARVLGYSDFCSALPGLPSVSSIQPPKLETEYKQNSSVILVDSQTSCQHEGPEPEIVTLEVDAEISKGVESDKISLEHQKELSSLGAKDLPDPHELEVIDEVIVESVEPSQPVPDDKKSEIMKKRRGRPRKKPQESDDNATETQSVKLSLDLCLQKGSLKTAAQIAEDVAQDVSRILGSTEVSRLTNLISKSESASSELTQTVVSQTINLNVTELDSTIMSVPPVFSENEHILHRQQVKEIKRDTSSPSVRKSSRVRKRKVDADTVFLYPSKRAKLEKTPIVHQKTPGSYLVIHTGKRGRPKKTFSVATVEVASRSSGSQISHIYDDTNTTGKQRKVSRKGSPRKCVQYADLNSSIEVSEGLDELPIQTVVLATSTNSDRHKSVKGVARKNVCATSKAEPSAFSTSTHFKSSLNVATNRILKAAKAYKLKVLHKQTMGTKGDNKKQHLQNRATLSTRAVDELNKANQANLTSLSDEVETVYESSICTTIPEDSQSSVHRSKRRAAIKARKMFGSLNLEDFATETKSKKHKNEDEEFVPSAEEMGELHIMDEVTGADVMKELENYKEYYVASKISNVSTEVTKAMTKRWMEELEKTGKILCPRKGCGRELETKPGMQYHYKFSCVNSSNSWLCKLCDKRLKPYPEIMLKHMKRRHTLHKEPEYNETDKVYTLPSFFDLKSNVLFPKLQQDHVLGEFKCLRSSWKLLSPCDEKPFLPPYASSPKFIVSNSSSHWFDLNRFESTDISKTSCETSFFTGGPISSTAWCPTPHSKPTDQYLAIATRSELGVTHIPTSTESRKSLLQLWNMGVLQNKEFSNKPALKLLMALNYGCIWEVAWCPSGCWESPDRQADKNIDTLPRLGLIAIACSDSFVRIYSLPQPDSLNCPSSSLPMYDVKPVAILEPLHGGMSKTTQKTMCTTLCWQKTDNLELIAGGYANGLISVWQLSRAIGLMTAGDTDSKPVLPFLTFLAHGASLSGIDFAPLSGGRWLASYGIDRTLKVWDLEDTSMPNKVLKKCGGRNMQWPSIWTGIFMSCDESFCSKCGADYINCLSHKLRVTGLHQHDGHACSASVSVFLDLVAVGDSAGLVTLTTLGHMSDKHKRKRDILLLNFKVQPPKENCDTYSKPSNTLPAMNIAEEVENLMECMIKHTEDVIYNGEKEAVVEISEVVSHDAVTKVEPYSTLTAVTSVAWNPNKGSHCWLLAAGQSGIAKLVCASPTIQKIKLTGQKILL